MLNELFALIEERRRNPEPGSYTNRLLAEGENKILKKINEEASEVLIAAKAEGNARLVAEVADLFYHTLVLLASRELTLADVEAELRSRHGKRREA
jgi:phosphoribosyl-ATP pyrophosphohydrolase